MEVTYERDVSHCSKSRYVKKVTINFVEHAQNSDNLDVIKFEETGWQAVVKRDGYKIGDKVWFVPPESVLPFELSEALNVTTYLSKGRVKVAKLRGNRSEGLVVDGDIMAPYINYIIQWEDLPEVQMAGNKLKKRYIPYTFIEFYKIPNLLNEPDTFKIGERIYYSEKVHGTSSRFSVMKNPSLKPNWLKIMWYKIIKKKINEYQLYVGSHISVLQESEENLYWKVVKEAIKDIKLPEDYLFFGEVYGYKVQDIQYDLKGHKMKVFNIWKDWKYMDLKEAKKLCEDLGLPFVEIHEDTFQGLEWAREIADRPSEVYNGFREGIVIVSAEDPNKMAKVIGRTYMERRDKNKTERH